MTTQRSVSMRMNQNDDRRDREVDAEIDQRAADHDQRHVAEKASRRARR